MDRKMSKANGWTVRSPLPMDGQENVHPKYRLSKYRFPIFRLFEWTWEARVVMCRFTRKTEGSAEKLYLLSMHESDGNSICQPIDQRKILHKNHCFLCDREWMHQESTSKTMEWTVD